MTVTLSEPERHVDSFIQHVRGCSTGGEVLYFVSVLSYDRKEGTAFRVQHVYDGRWEVIGENVSHTEARRLVNDHFNNSYRLMNAEEEPV